MDLSYVKVEYVYWHKCVKLNNTMEYVFSKIESKLTFSQKTEQRIEAAVREKKLPVGLKLPAER